jgi:hypothetical protein
MNNYKGSCHCGAFVFNVDLELEGLITCNCSMCQRTGYVMAFVAPEALHVEAGEGTLKRYTFNTMNIDHLFCTTCGIHPISKGKKKDGSPMRMINVRCLHDVDPTTLATKQVNGRAVPSAIPRGP